MLKNIARLNMKNNTTEPLIDDPVDTIRPEMIGKTDLEQVIRLCR